MKRHRDPARDFLDNRREVAVGPAALAIDFGAPEAVGHGAGDAAQLGLHLLELGVRLALFADVSGGDQAVGARLGVQPRDRHVDRDPLAFLLVAWDRGRHNKGARTAGVDGQNAHYVQAAVGVEEFLARLRASVKDRSFCPVPVREQMIPKAGGKQRRLGIATITDRVVQASTSSAGASSATASEAPAGATSTPTRPAKPSRQ